MRDWLESLAGPEYASAVLWTLLALVVLVIVLVIVRIVRSLTAGTFVVGGRNRKTRLAVMDATAVDSHRRLVLVRRDDVEHLILIGGQTDIVVERDIRVGSTAPRRQQPPVQPARPPREAQPTQPLPAATQAPSYAPHQSSFPHGPAGIAPAPAAPSPRPAPAPAPAPRPAPEPARYAEPSRPQPPLRAPEPPRMPEPVRPAAAPEPARTQPARTTPPPFVTQSRASQPAPRPAPPTDEIDDALLKELEVSLDEAAPMVSGPRDVSLDEEMTKLLGELSNKTR